MLTILILAGLSSIFKVAVFLVILGVLIVFHEFGHFVFAKRFGVTVNDFAVGFGPTLFVTRRGGTNYRLNALPLGGYCNMLGEDSAEGIGDPGNFQNKPVWVRFLIILAGPVFNFVLAAAIFAFIGSAVGLPTPTNVVQQVQPGSPAAAAGLMPGDEIVMLDGSPVRSGAEMVDYIHQRANKLIAVDVLHRGTLEYLRIKARPISIAGQTVGQFGFAPRLAYQHMAFGPGILWGFSMVRDTVYQQVTGIVGAIERHDASVVSGPVGIAHYVIAAEDLGIFWVLQIAGILSVVLGLFNLLPWPALDGGRLAFLVVEAVRGRPIPPEKEGLVHATGFALLMVLVVFITYHDIRQWIGGHGGL
jgi:regulator of sigma E protease